MVKGCIEIHFLKKIDTVNILLTYCKHTVNFTWMFDKAYLVFTTNWTYRHNTEHTHSCNT